MSKFETKQIKLSNLLINIENPRYEPVSSQKDAIKVMINEQAHKIYNLAEDILNFGINPTELIMVKKDGSSRNRYLVLEGNRRITALKLLETPELLGKEYDSLKRKFTLLNKQYVKEPIHLVNSVVFNEEKDSYKWIKLRHTGENLGVGIVNWNAQQSSRFDMKVAGRSAVAIQALDFMKNSDDVPNSIKESLGEVKSSSLKRLIGDKDVKEFLGLKIENGTLKSEIHPKEVAKGLIKVVKDLLKDDFGVSRIYHKKDRLKYLETFNKREIPNKKKSTTEEWELNAISNIDSKILEPKKKSKPLSTKRKQLIPREFIIKIKENKPNKIYNELKRLNVDEFENCAAVLFRVFVELSIDSYIKNKEIPVNSEKEKLSRKAHFVADHMEKNSIATKHQLKSIRTAVTNRHSVLSIDTFHSYVHNLNYSPIANDLKTAWDNMQEFIEILWSNV